MLLASDSNRSLYVLLSCQFLTPIATQSFAPVLALAVTNFVQGTTTQVGYAFAILVSFSVVASLAFIRIKAGSTRTLLMGAFLLRAISGVVYCLSFLTPAPIFFIYVSRAMHGLSLYTFAIPPAWVALRLPRAEAVRWTVKLYGVVPLGIVCGPVFGSVLSVVMPTPLLKYSSPGLVTVVTSCFLLFATFVVFDDDDTLSNPSRSSKQAELPARAIWVAFVTSFFFSLGYMGALESTLSLVVFKKYQADESQSLGVWSTFMLSNVTGFVVAANFQRHVSLLVLAWVCVIGRFSGLLMLDWNDETVPYFRFLSGLFYSMSS